MGLALQLCPLCRIGTYTTRLGPCQAPDALHRCTWRPIGARYNSMLRARVNDKIQKFFRPLPRPFSGHPSAFIRPHEPRNIDITPAAAPSSVPLSLRGPRGGETSGARARRAPVCVIAEPASEDSAERPQTAGFADDPERVFPGHHRAQPQSCDYRAFRCSGHL